MLSGILAVDKPAGWTSHDVVARIRRVAGQRQVGHAGTLDPLATGLLLLTLGRATRLSSYLMESPKVYWVEVVLGVTTTTDDAEGEIVRESAAEVSRADVEAALRRFEGEIEQVPPLYSAIQRDGRRQYERARKGEHVDPVPRRVTVHGIDLLGFDPPLVLLRVRCGSGTYIRALARDLGSALRVGAHAGSLRREGSGAFTVDDAKPLEALSDRGDVQDSLRPLDTAVAEKPALTVDDRDVMRLVMGQEVELDAPDEECLRVYGQSGSFIALARLAGRRLRPSKVFVRPGEIHEHPA